MPILEPLRYETEEILQIPIESTGGQKCYVISGFADFTDGDGRKGVPRGFGARGDSHDDERWTRQDLHLIVGREWHEIIGVSPTAGIAGYSFQGSDETDSTGIELENCRWDTVGVGNSAFERIRLKIRLRMCGGISSAVTKISYHLTAIVIEPGVVG